MHNAFSVILGLIVPVWLAATISNATAAPPAKAEEDRYIAARDAAIAKISASTMRKHGGCTKAESASRFAAQMRHKFNDRRGLWVRRSSTTAFNARVSACSTAALNHARKNRKGWPGWAPMEVCRAGAYRHGADAVRTMAARPQGGGATMSGTCLQIGGAEGEVFIPRRYERRAAVVNFVRCPSQGRRRDLRMDAGGRTRSTFPAATRYSFCDRQWQGVRRLRIDRSQQSACIAIRRQLRQRRTGRTTSGSKIDRKAYDRLETCARRWTNTSAASQTAKRASFAEASDGPDAALRRSYALSRSTLALADQAACQQRMIA
jgi:hypothetical protein